MDKYEASVWSIDSANKGLIGKVQQGKVALSHLIEGGAVQRGTNVDDYGLAGCLDNGNGCTTVYAVSLAGVTPAHSITWFQAAAACANASRRLLTNVEWQVAALGTPDPGALVTSVLFFLPLSQAGKPVRVTGILTLLSEAREKKE